MHIPRTVFFSSSSFCLSAKLICLYIDHSILPYMYTYLLLIIHSIFIITNFKKWGVFSLFKLKRKGKMSVSARLSRFPLKIYLNCRYYRSNLEIMYLNLCHCLLLLFSASVRSQGQCFYIDRIISSFYADVPCINTFSSP